MTFVALFGAGAVSGLVADRLTDRHKPMGGKRDAGSVLARELSLTPDQHQKMKEIWSGVHEQMGQSRDKRRELLKQREESVRGLLTDAQKVEYEKIFAEYEKKQEALRESGEKSVRDAEEKTREILTAEQRVKYEEMLKQRQGNEKRGPGGPPGGPGGPPGGAGTTKP